MGDENVAEFAAAEAGEPALSEFLEDAAEEIVGAEADQLRKALGGLLTDVDREVLTGALGEYMVQSTDVGLGGGISGWLDDDLAFIADWGFELGAIAAPVTIWQGEQDRMVPFAHGPWLAGHVAGGARAAAARGGASVAGREPLRQRPRRADRSRGMSLPGSGGGRRARRDTVER